MHATGQGGSHISYQSQTREIDCILMIGEKSQLRCAGINRHEAEDESSSRERSSDPLGLESCAGYREVLSEA